MWNRNELFAATHTDLLSTAYKDTANNVTRIALHSQGTQLDLTLLPGILSTTLQATPCSISFMFVCIRRFAKIRCFVPQVQSLSTTALTSNHAQMLFSFVAETGKDQCTARPGAAQQREHRGSTGRRERGAEKHERIIERKKWNTPCESIFTNTRTESE